VQIFVLLPGIGKNKSFMASVSTLIRIYLSRSEQSSFVQFASVRLLTKKQMLEEHPYDATRRQQRHRGEQYLNPGNH